MVHGDDGEHLVQAERLEADVGVEAGIQHGLAAQHLVAAGTADEQQAELGVEVVMKVAEIFEALAVQPLRLIDDDQTGTVRERGLERHVDAEGIGRQDGAEPGRAMQGVTHVTKRWTAAEVHPDPAAGREVDQSLLDGEALARPGSAD